MRACTCIRDPRDVRRVAVQDPHCPACHATSAVQGAPYHLGGSQPT